jgi:hypothetical protein
MSTLSESIWRGAWRELEQFRNSFIGFWGIEVIAALAGGTVAVWRLASATSSPMAQTIYGGVGVVAGLALAFLGIYMVCVVVTPYRQRNQAREEIQELERRLAALENKRVHTSAELAYDEPERWYRIIIHNENPRAPAEDVNVKLEEIDPVPPRFKTLELPCRLGRKDAREEDRKTEIIRINPGATEQFDLVKHLGGSAIVIFTTVWQQRVELKGAEPYRFRIRVTVGNPDERMPHDGAVEDFIAILNGEVFEVSQASEISSA